MQTQIFYSETPEIFFDKLQLLLTKVVKNELANNTPKEQTNEPFIKIEEACKLLKVTKPTIHKHVRLGYYKKHYVGRKILFEKNEILDFIKSEDKHSKSNF